MMTLQLAKETLNHWLALLGEIVSIEVDCEMPPDELTSRLDRRQQVIARIQQLDGSLTAVKKFRQSHVDDPSVSELDILMTQGREISDSIRDRNLEIIEIAKEKRREILGMLHKSSRSKGYLSANHAPKIRPPVIVDGNA